jgi:hypothetical protein
VTSAAAADRASTPLEYTSRWPRLVNHLGRNASAAANDTSRGKSAKEVLAARTRMARVAAWNR